MYQRLFPQLLLYDPASLRQIRRPRTHIVAIAAQQMRPPCTEHIQIPFASPERPQALGVQLYQHRQQHDPLQHIAILLQRQEQLQMCQYDPVFPLDTQSRQGVQLHICPLSKGHLQQEDVRALYAQGIQIVLLRQFEERRVPILLGTQMVAKGLDFENVTLVGVLSADLSLYVDHYRAAERTFNLLTQVVGRAGRGAKEGRAVIQTYTPENDVIQAAAAQDYERFYRSEIQLRRLRRDPPFADQFIITVSGGEEDDVRRAVGLLRSGLDAAVKKPPYDDMGLELIGPAPAPVVRVNGSYRYRLLLLGENNAQVRGLLSSFMRAFAQRAENRRLHIRVDCDLMD